MKKAASFSIVLVLALSMLFSACTLSAINQPTRIPSGNPTTASNVQKTQAQGVTSLAPTSLPAQPATTVPQPTGGETVVTATTAPATAVPPAATATSAPPAATAVPAAASNATRIQFASGSTKATVNGVVNGGAVVDYVLQAGAEQTMQVAVWSPNGDVYLTILGATDGKQLVKAADKATQWAGVLPTSQDYQVSLTAGGGQTSYSMEVAVVSPSTPVPASATPTATTVTATKLDPVATWGKATYSDPMNGSNKSDWVTSDGTWPDTQFIRLAIDSGKMYVTGKQFGFSTWWFTWRSLKDSYLEMSFASGACSGKDAYGFILRGPAHGASDSHGYLVALSCDGSYQVTRLDSIKPYTATVLVDWTKSDYIASGANQTNLLGVRTMGKNITIYANGYQIGQIADATYLEGRYGLFVSSMETPNYTYRPFNLSYWVIGQ